MNKIKNIKLGIIFGIGAIFVYGIINLLSQESDHFFSTKNTITFAAIFVMVKEFVAIITYFFIDFKPYKKTKTLFNSYKKENKIMILASIAGFFGGALGFVFTTAGGILVSSGLASPFYTIEIVVVIIAAKLLFKRKINIFHIIGIFLITTSIILISVYPLWSQGVETSKNMWIGIILVILGVFSWAVESLIFDKITEKTKVPIDSLVVAKQIASFLILIIILVPVFSLLETKNISTGYHFIGDLFTSKWQSFLFMIAAGFLLYIGRVLFFTSIKYQGATIANVIYNLLIIIQIPLAFIFEAIDPSINFIGNINWWYFIPFNILNIIGVLLTIKGQSLNEYKKL